MLRPSSRFLSVDKDVGAMNIYFASNLVLVL